MTIAVRQASPTDLEALRCRGGLDVPGLYAQQWVAFEVDYRVAAVWGVLMRWPHVADLCGAVDHDLIRPYRFSFVRESRRLLKDVARRLQLRRITAFVEASRPDFQRFAEAAGFRAEATLALAGPDGGDIIIYVRTYPWAALSVRSLEALRSQRQPLLPLQPRPLSRTTARCGSSTASGLARRATATSRI